MNGWEGPPPRDVCIVMLSALGDAVHVLPLVGALKRAWPEVRITWVIQPVPHRLVAGHPAVDEFVVFERRRGPSAWQSFLDLRRTMSGRRFDLLLGLQVYFKAGLITALTPAEVKLGFDRARARDAQWLFTTHRIPAHEPQHVQDQYFEFLTWLGLEHEPVEWGLAPTDAERAEQARFFSRIERPACAVVVGTSKPEKNWSVEGYTAVVDALFADFGLQPVILGGPSRIERDVAAAVCARAAVPVVEALGDDVRRLVWALDGCALAISPDTGPLHIARALGTPVVALHGPTDPKRSGPYRAFEDLVVSGYPQGMERVTAERVLEKVGRALAHYVTADRGDGDG